MISNWVFEVEILVDQKKETVHARRLMWYRSDRDGQELSPSLVAYAEHTETVYQDVKRLMGIRKMDGLLEVLIEWEGLPDVVDQTWEPLVQIIEDVPDRLRNFFKSPNDNGLKSDALRILNES